jgi:predicted ATP-grasp superfamily ATP-dependent carboligase
VLRAVGEALAREFQLVGLFGVDFLLDRGVVRPVEVNPRYPASVEVLEHALGISAIALHAGACAGSNAAAPTEGPRGGVGREGVLGKAVVYAPRDVIAPRGLLPETGGATSDPWRWPGIADVPRAGTRVPAGAPLLTVFARGAERRELPARAAAGGGASAALFPAPASAPSPRPVARLP